MIYELTMSNSPLLHFKTLFMAQKILCFFLFLICASGAKAQSEAEPTEQIYIDLSTNFSIVDNSYTSTWKPGTGLHLNIRLPFYAGQIEAGMRYNQFDGPVFKEVDSNFKSLYLHLGWSYPITVASWYHIAPGFRFGNNLMLFDEARTYTNDSDTERFTVDTSESEFAYELVLRNQFNINEHWHINANISYSHTMTYFPLPVTYLSIGVSYSFSQPSWLKNIIQ